MARRSKSNSARAAAFAACVVLFVAVGAQAQSDTEASLADSLYRQARELSASGNFAEACPKFAESYRLDPGTGTLLNLASCHESLGQLATAWVEYKEALVRSRRDRQQSRIDFAETHIAALSPKLSSLTLKLASGADMDGLQISVDGVAVGVAALGASTPLDPGTHTVEATAPGKKPWSGSLIVGAAAEQSTLVIPPLVALPPPPGPVRVEVTPLPLPPPTLPTTDVTNERPVPTAAYVAGGATVALALAASITGGVYLDRRASYDSSPSYDAHDRDSLRALGVVNLALWIATVGGAGATTYFYVTRPTAPASPSARFMLTPWASATGGGLLAGGTL